MTLGERIDKLGVGTIIAFVLMAIIIAVGLIMANRDSADYPECTAEYVDFNGDSDCKARQEKVQDQYLQKIEEQAQ